MITDKLVLSPFDLMGLGGMVPRENLNNGATYDMLNASQQGLI